MESTTLPNVRKSLVGLRDEGWMHYVEEESVPPSLICPICHSPFLDPVSVKRCDHLFCRSCIMQVRDSVCPLDRMEFKSVTDLVSAPKIVHNLVDELLVKCADADCDWFGRRDALISHLENKSVTHHEVMTRKCEENTSRHSNERCSRLNANLYSEEFDVVNPDPKDVVVLNVGGTHMMTSRKVLCVQSNSKLAALFSGAVSLRSAENGTIFLDRNGDSFSELLKWLRNNDDTIPIPEYALAEARFWGIKVKDPCCILPLLMYSDVLRLVEVALHNKTPVSLPKVRMSGFYFGGLVLGEANFRRSCLRGASFAGAYLAKADFRECDLVDADFSGAVLNGANFYGAVLRRTCFSNVSSENIILPAKFHCNCGSECPFNLCTK